ncbi:SIFamide-related peptide [Anoplolepis gracilipes]|uniref:SIFamide-related peptide n=1 Tax=Anoplolepis gracilipes TaxID=354296 RepID=UPI003BA10455
MVSIRVTFALAVIVVIFAFNVDAAYKKPPFNGSIFGKRSNTMTDYEFTYRTLSAICDFMSETCSAWPPRQESN